MRNHSHCNRNRLARDGGWLAPNPGRQPEGAKKSARNPASSSMPSDWYPEKSWAALTKERKQAKQTRSMARGKTLQVTSSEAARPAQQRAMTACEPLPNQSTDGANQYRAPIPYVRATACR